MVEPDPILLAAAHARAEGRVCALATVVRADGSCPREIGARMLVRPDGSILGTVGGGKFESLVIAEGLRCLREHASVLREYPLHEGSPDSFGAICGGTVAVFIEAIGARERVFISGGGHVGEAVALLARQCGWFTQLHDDRTETGLSQEAFVQSVQWGAGDALVIVNRNPELDRRALAAVLSGPSQPGYIGMIGSVRKVRRVFAQLREAGFSAETLAGVHAPIGLDLGAETPAEIAVSIVAELLAALRSRPGGSLRISPP